MPGPLRRVLLRLLAVAIVVTTTVATAVAIVVPAAATAPAEPTGPEIRRQLDATAGRLQHAEEQEAELSDDLEVLQRKIEGAELDRAGVQQQVAAYVSAAYKGGRGIDPMLTLMTETPSGNALGNVAMLDHARRHSRATIARLTALNRELRVAREAITNRQSKLEGVRAELTRAGAELETLFASVSQQEAATESKLATEAARLRRVRLAADRAKLERNRQLRATRDSRAEPDPGADDSDSPEPDGGSPPDSGAAQGSGFACPVGPANTFRDTWGDRRSGGRRHKGTDIFAPHGSPAYAVTDGVIAGVRSGGLGGKSIILRGDNGDSYYYAHESSIDVHAGQRVRAGELIGRVGSSGNADGGSPHVHFERWPGGGRPADPYLLLRRICG